MNIMIGINQKYVFPAKVMLTSLFENNKFEKHNVFLLYDKNNLEIKGIDDLKKLEKKYNTEIFPVMFDSSIFEKFPMSDHFSIETYFRLMAQDMLPNELDRVLWIDADIIVIKSIKDFYYQNFEGKLVVASKTANENANTYLEKLGLNSDVGYFNAGVILFNLVEMRKKISTNIYFECLAEYKDRIHWLDQDILNIVFANDKKLIDNQCYNYTFMSDKKFSNSEEMYIKNNVVLLHYIGGEKPWHLSYQNKMIKYFRKYARKQESLLDSLNFDLKYIYGRLYSKLKK